MCQERRQGNGRGERDRAERGTADMGKEGGGEKWRRDDKEEREGK